jgi:hypothetical protein
MLVPRSIAYLVVMCVFASTALAQKGNARLSIYDSTRTDYEIDPNGFLLNPRWLGELQSPNIEEWCRFRVNSEELETRTLWMTGPNCLSESERRRVSLNEATHTLGIGFECGTGSVVGKVRGHVNWFPMTAVGTLHWVGYSGGPGEDHDLTFDFWPLGPNALTSGNAHRGGQPAGYHVEFYHAETLLRLPSDRGADPSLWQSLNSAMNKRGNTRDSLAQHLLTGRFAILTGLYGVDAVHNLHAEFHPVFGLSILEGRHQTDSATLVETWSFMVRDRGNEGDCAEGEIPMFTAKNDFTSFGGNADIQSVNPQAGENYQHFVVDQGWLAEASTVSVKLGASWSTHPQLQPSVRVERGQHLYLDFKHPKPTPGRNDFLFLGTITITWKASKAFALGLKSLSMSPSSSASFKMSSIPNITSNIAEMRKTWSYGGRSSGLEKALAPYNRLSEVPRRPLGQIETHWSPAKNPMVYTAPRWIRPDTMETVDCVKGEFRLRSLCRGRWRLVAQTGLTAQAEVSSAVSIFVHAHSWSSDKVPDVPEALLGGFAYRFELRNDFFYRKRPSGKTRLSGGSFRVSPMLGPNALRLSGKTTLAPYTILSPGVVRLKDASYGTMGVGFGLQVMKPTYDWFVEGVRYTAAGFEGQHRFSVGMALPSIKALRSVKRHDFGRSR